MTLLSARGLEVRLGGRVILHEIDLSIDRQEVVTLVGPNGSGKSTLLRTLLGIVRPTKGQVTRSVGMTIGYVPQRLGLTPALPITVDRFMDLGRQRVRGGLTAKDALSETGADGLGSRAMADLSGGQFQRVLLARAIQGTPSLLILDEPTQSLDQPGTAAFYALIDRIRQALNCAVFMVSHDLNVVMRTSDRVICLNGHVCCQGAPYDVSVDPAYRALFGADVGGTLGLYLHQHDHSHDDGCTEPHDHHHAEGEPTDHASAG